MKNVILLTIDTLRQDVFDCYGSKDGLTPFIDSIQDKCIRFKNAQSCGPYTQASFPAILSSSYYLEYEKTKKLSVKRTLISEVLKEKGIITAGFHSNAYLCAFFGWNRGWNMFYDSMEADVDDYNPYIKADKLNRRVEKWLAGRKDKDAPFFLWLHYMDVHEPYVPEKKYIEQAGYSIDLSDKEMFDLFNDVVLPRDISDGETVEILKKLYKSHVTEVDTATKELFGILESEEVLSDTAVVITSDHGDEFGEHGGLSHDGKMFKELIDVPLFIYDQSLPAGKSVDKVISTLDVSPTIASMFGINNVEEFFGDSLLPLENLEDRTVFGEAFFKHGSKENNNPKEVHYVREGSLKVIYNENDNSWLMFDIAADPEEKVNIVESHPDAEKLKNKIKPRIRRSLEK
jgi:arylsulfatase A-like enzyme